MKLPECKPAEAAKHQLDLYLPTDAKVAPVFLFVHGGAWRFGDRGLYPPLGQRFAKEGIVTVIPSHRLAPKSPWPAQAEDTAAALAWTVRHIADNHISEMISLTHDDDPTAKAVVRFIQKHARETSPR